MTDLMSRFTNGQLIEILAGAAGLLCAVVAIVANAWAKVRRSEHAASVRVAMLERGMSADEIQTAVEAGSQKSCRSLSAWW
jgi:hypothetical protein